MPDFLASLATTDSIIHIGALFYLSGFLFRDQVFLRAMIVLGDIVYILYFYFAPETPLWGGIFWSAAFVLVNLWMLWTVLADRRHYALTEAESRLFRQLGSLTPGQFRILLRLGRMTEADGRTELTREGEGVEKLFFLTEGEAEIAFADRPPLRRGNTFIGEIAFLTGQPASASVTVDKGARYMAWPADTLRATLRRQPELQVALERAMNMDMAAKVAGRPSSL